MIKIGLSNSSLKAQALNELAHWMMRYGATIDGTKPQDIREALALMRETEDMPQTRRTQRKESRILRFAEENGYRMRDDGTFFKPGS